MVSKLNQGIRAAKAGLWTNAGLVSLKLVTGLLGNSYALVADAIESSTDVFSSLIVWRGLEITGKPPDEDYPYGYGKADSIAAAVVALLLIGAAVSIMVLAVREILTPHHAPEPFTLIVLGGVIIGKEFLFRRVLAVGHETGSTAVMADAWHHRSDALTSGAAFIGIAVALWGGPGWEAADDWAAAAAAVIIGANGVRLLRPAVNDLMDRTPESDLLDAIGRAAQSVPGVLAIEKVRSPQARHGLLRRPARADRPDHDSPRGTHTGWKSERRIRTALPKVNDVLVHMEPYEPGG